MQQLSKYLEEGKIRPIRPVTVFGAVDIEKAFWHMQGGRHIGKIVVKMPDDFSTLISPNSDSPVSLSPNSSFLLVGGLGGIGRAVASWMVEKGARHFVFLSRSAGISEKSQAFLKELESQGCTAITISGSVTNSDDVHRAIAACTRPLEGVIQMSMVLRVSSKLLHMENIITLIQHTGPTTCEYDA